MLVTVERYFDPWEAHIVCARLRAEAIPATVAGDQHMMMKWPLCIALGGAMLQVPDPFRQTAQRVIADYNAGVFKQDLVDLFPNAIDTCPACESSDIVGSIPPGQRIVAVMTTLIAWAPFPTSATDMSFSACGHRWYYGRS